MCNKIVSTCWDEIRNEVYKANPIFAKLVDNLNLDKSFIIYKAFYPYGATIGDESYFYYPGENDNPVTISDLPKQIILDLEYANGSIPLGMVLHNNVELFINRDGLSIPRTIYTPGTFFALPRELDNFSRELDSSYNSYHLSRLLNMSSGARSIFLLPNIGDAVKHVYIQKYFGIKTLPSKTYHSHWELFHQIATNKLSKCDWSACLLYFSKKWLDHLRKDPVWQELKLYLFQQAWKMSSFHRNEIYYNYVFSLIQQQRNLKPNPYIADTANHLLAIATGAYPGFVPATDNSCAPISLLQKVFTEIYGLQYTPTIIHPYILKPDCKHNIIYYSLQYPSTIVFSPKSRRIASTLHELRELKYISEILFNEIGFKTPFCSNTIVSNVARCTDLDFYHNKSDPHGEIKLSAKIPNEDARFTKTFYKSQENKPFADAATFVRGCAKLTIKKNEI